MVPGELGLALAMGGAVRFAAEQSVIGFRAKLQQRAQRSHAVHPAELFALRSAAGVVMDGDFVNAVTESHDAGRYVRLDVKPFAAQAQPAPKIRPQDLVPSLHVREVAIEQ